MVTDEAYYHALEDIALLRESLESLVKDYDEWSEDPVNGGTRNIHDLYEQARAALKATEES